MKKSLQLRVLSLLTLICLGVGSAWSATYTKITSTEDLTDGKYLIVYEAGNLAFDGALESLDVANNNVEVTISENKIVTSTDCYFTIAAIEGGYSIQSQSGYYIGRNNDANGMLTNASTKYVNTISFSTNGTADIVGSGGAYLRYNSATSDQRFRYYKSSTYASQKAVCLYKESAEPEGFTVYFDNFNEWSSEAPHIWAWNDGGNLVEGDYPGPAMTLVDGETTLYVWESESTPTGIIITNQDETKAGGGYIDNPVNGATYYSNGTTTQPAEGEIVVAVVGAFNSWNGSANSTNEIVDNCATFVVENYQNEVEGQGHGFKFTIDGAGWYGTDATITNGDWFDTTAGSEANIDLPEEANGKTVTFTFAVNTFSFKAEWTSSEEPGEEATTATINFGTNEGSTKINSKEVTGKDSKGRTWTITTVSNDYSFTQQPTYSQIGASSKPATSFTAVCPISDNITITRFEAKLGGFSKTAGNISLKIGDVEVATGSLNGTTDVTIEANSISYDAQGKSLSVSVTNIAKGVKFYSISYDYVTSTGVESVEIDMTQPARYYNLQGVEVANPSQGIFIRVRGSKVDKVVVR